MVRYRSSLLTCALLAVVGCSDPQEPLDPQEPEVPGESIEPGGPVEEPAPQPLELVSATACVIDDDCVEGLFCFQQVCARTCESDGDCGGGTCSSRGRCMNADGEVPVPHRLPELKVEGYPETTRIIKDGESTITLEFLLNAPVPAEGIAYRIERTDGGGDPQQILFATGQGRSFSLDVETGDAEPGRQSPAGPVRLTLFSSVGDFDFYFEPEAGFEGTWHGKISVDGFGGTQKLDLMAHIIGSAPNGLSMVLSVGGAHLFSPRDDHDPQRDYERVPVEYRSQLDAYQAIFVQEYRFDEGLFAGLRSRQVERTLRFDFDGPAFREGRLEGRVTDLWRGLYDQQRSSGAREIGTVRYDGSVVLERIDELARPAAEFVVASGTPAQPALIERAAPGHCPVDAFAVDPVEEGLETWSCEGITSVETFMQAGAEERALCALTVAQWAIEGETTSEQLARFFAEESEPMGMSFEQFLQACADDANPVCQPSPMARCAYDLVAYAAHDVYRTRLENDGERADFLLEALMIALGDVSNEAFSARQLGAFYNDIELRRQWLRNATAPTLFLDAVERANMELLDQWQAQVLEVQRDVFQGFFSQDVLTLLSRPINGEEANARRVRMLTEASTLWRGYAEGLMLAATRWNEVIRDEGERDARARWLQLQALELYLLMGMINDFNRIAGVSNHQAALASNFGQLTDKINELATSFDDAIFARDAEVVVARSLNPLSDNNSLLSERRAHALAAVDNARESIEGILDDVTIEALSEADMRSRINNERRLSANRIAELCGLPAGCSETDVLVNEACIQVETGQCGLLNAANPEIDATFDPSRVAASEAGRAVLAVLESYHNVAIQNDELNGFLLKLELQYQELEAFKEDIESWNRKRLEGLEQLQRNLATRDRIRDERIREMLDNFDARARVRSEQVRAMETRFGAWDELRRGQGTTNFQSKLEELATLKRANILEAVGAKASAKLDAVAEALPKTKGASNDVYAGTRASLLFSSNIVAIGSSYAAEQMRLMSEHQGYTRELHQELFEANLSRLDEEAQIDDAIRDHELAALEEAAMVSDQLFEDDLEQLREAIELMREQREAELAYARDMAEFRTRRTAYLQDMVDISGRVLRVDQSRFNVVQRFLEYDNVVQKARLEAARLAELDRQLIDLDTLVGGIGAVFSRTYAIERAESHLDEARQALMDWLVVIEYYAVRPFVAQRVQIHLARNAYQLEAIAQKLQQIENTCGGSERSKETAILSLRRQVLGLIRPQQGASPGEVLAPAERFRRWLTQAYVPVDRRINFSTSESLSHLLERNEGVLAATFTLGLNDFANLDLACNAKIESIAVQLVGDLGDLQPTVTVLYDGTSQLRSCQPNVAEYVRTQAEGRTAYDTITQLRTAGRAMSPLAGVNAFLSSEASVNRSLAGLPVSSEYTLLISTTRGDNAGLDWSRLEDVLIRVEYSYQDLFAEACAP